MRRSFQRGKEEEPAMEAAEQNARCKEGKSSDGSWMDNGLEGREEGARGLSAKTWQAVRKTSSLIRRKSSGDQCKFSQSGKEVFKTTHELMFARK